MFAIEFLAPVGGNSTVFHAMHYFTVVGNIIIVFFGYVCDYLTVRSNLPYVWVVCLDITQVIIRVENHLRIGFHLEKGLESLERVFASLSLGLNPSCELSYMGWLN